jgi:pyruvate ferredoxin oxidoreductase gamma subunit
MVNVVFFGRGGQGVKTIGHVLALAGFYDELNVQAFPEYGPERSGAPMKTFVKVSKGKIEDQAPFSKADFVVVIDSSLLNLIRDNILSLGDNKTKFIFNAKSDVDVKNSKTINATQIALDVIGKDYSNVVMLGALIKESKLVSLSKIEKALKEVFAKKPKALELNLKAMNLGYKGLK